MVTTGLIVRLTAKAGQVDELAAFLRDALPLVQEEPETIAWFAVAIGEASFAIIDAFPDEQGRQAHLDGPVAAALFGRAAGGSCVRESVAGGWRVRRLRPG